MCLRSKLDIGFSRIILNSGNAGYRWKVRYEGAIAPPDGAAAGRSENG